MTGPEADLDQLLEEMGESGEIDVAELAARTGMSLDATLDALGPRTHTLTVSGGQNLAVAQGGTVHQTNNYTVRLPEGVTLGTPARQRAVIDKLREAARNLAHLLKTLEADHRLRAHNWLPLVEPAALTMVEQIAVAIEANVPSRDLNQALRAVSTPVLQWDYTTTTSPQLAEQVQAYGAYLVVMGLTLLAINHQQYARLGSALRTRVAMTSGREVELAFLRYVMKDIRIPDNGDRWGRMRDLLLQTLAPHLDQHDRLDVDYAVAEAVADAAFQAAQNPYFERTNERAPLLTGGCHYDQRRYQAQLRAFVQDEGDALEAALPGIRAELLALRAPGMFGQGVGRLLIGRE